MRSGRSSKRDVQSLFLQLFFYEVLKILLLRAGKSDADVFLSEALPAESRGPHRDIVLAAASLSIDHKLPIGRRDHLRDSKSAITQQLITSDTHFVELPGVVVL